MLVVHWCILIALLFVWNFNPDLSIGVKHSQTLCDLQILSQYYCELSYGAQESLLLLSTRLGFSYYFVRLDAERFERFFEESADYAYNCFDFRLCNFWAYKISINDVESLYSVYDLSAYIVVMAAFTLFSLLLVRLVSNRT